MTRQAVSSGDPLRMTSGFWSPSWPLRFRTLCLEPAFNQAAILHRTQSGDQREDQGQLADRAGMLFFGPPSASAFANAARSRPPQHPFQLGRCEVLPFPREALLMHLEVRNALSDFLALRVVQIYRWHPVRFDNGARLGWFHRDALRKRYRFLDQRIKISFPVGHFSSPQRPGYRAQLARKN
jgi:hypothetical protein